LKLTRRLPDSVMWMAPDFIMGRGLVIFEVWRGGSDFKSAG
jgi:hypothetical protein